MTDKKKQIKAAPALTMHAQYIKDLSFENPRASNIFTKQIGQPDVEVSINVNANALENKQSIFTMSLFITSHLFSSANNALPIPVI